MNHNCACPRILFNFPPEVDLDHGAPYRLNVFLVES